MTNMNKGLLMYLMILFCNHLLANIIYVTPNGAGSLNGTSWENALSGTSLQMAFDNAALGDSVWVACGTYFASNTGDRSISFSMRNNLSIFGSFQGTESTFEERSFTCGPCSILSGNIGNPNLSSDNTYTIIVNNGLNNDAIIDGFEVRDGYDDRSVSSIENGLGGGIYNGGNGNGGFCSPTFRNMVIANNYATYGAGMFNNGYGGGYSAPILINCVIVFNTATVGGGGMDSYGWNNGDVAPTLINCLMYENHSNDRAGAMYCWGGLNGNCSPNIINSAIINNSANNIAGGVIVDNSDNLAGNPPFSGTAELNVTNSILWGNNASSGPQFYILGSGNFNAIFSNIDTIGQTNTHPIAGTGRGNHFLDPLFNDISNGIGIDDCWMTGDDGMSLMIASANINQGNASSAYENDLSNNPRISGAAIDIGPYEYQLLDSVEWSGGLNTVWGNANNWLPQRIPDSTQHISIPSNLLNYPVIPDSDIRIRSLLLEENAQIRLSEFGVLNVVGN